METLATNTSVTSLQSEGHLHSVIALLDRVVDAPPNGPFNFGSAAATVIGFQGLETYVLHIPGLWQPVPAWREQKLSSCQKAPDNAVLHILCFQHCRRRAFTKLRNVSVPFGASVTTGDLHMCTSKVLRRTCSKQATEHVLVAGDGIKMSLHSAKCSHWHRYSSFLAFCLGKAC